MNIEDMTVEDIERELVARDKAEQDVSVDLNAGGYLDLARAEMRKNPAKFMENNASVANKILELDAKALERQNSKLYRANDYSLETLQQLTPNELQKLFLEEFAQHIPPERLESFYQVGTSFLQSILEMR